MQGGRLFLAALAAVSMLSLPVTEAAAQRRPAARPAVARDWTRVAVRTPDGVRIGNPAAPVKLVEYGSITCPHCAAFANEGGTAGLYRYIRTGRVSWEYRPYVIFPTDPGMFAGLNCLAPGAFFPTLERLYATQRSWVSLVQTWLEANQSQVQAMSGPQRSLALFRAGRVEGVYRAGGLTPAQINACVGNPANLQRVVGGNRRAEAQANFAGTPGFYINGTNAPVVTWDQLEPILIQAGARR